MNIQTLADGLSEAQRRAVLRVQDYDDGTSFFRLGDGRGMCPLGLGARTIDGIQLTPLGQQVRDYLENTDGK